MLFLWSQPSLTCSRNHLSCCWCCSRKNRSWYRKVGETIQVWIKYTCISAVLINAKNCLPSSDKEERTNSDTQLKCILHHGKARWQKWGGRESSCLFTSLKLRERRECWHASDFLLLFIQCWDPWGGAIHINPLRNHLYRHIKSPPHWCPRHFITDNNIN